MHICHAFAVMGPWANILQNDKRERFKRGFSALTELLALKKASHPSHAICQGAAVVLAVGRRGISRVVGDGL